ncbi:hypothetical protein BESB_014060 [Besnoitia besnoiti]|uniref:ABC1 atypical kinase-like domain-containing protein n=1 Tax=Besnoitia besnoiti TaxID=94643 RepID=A0A2A9M6I4_BESBE|nr:hypothetical protein BESB_014060 [Besnoitia besnoiti]PFH32794.1 hypothetical protein BESB_014060 [Besnoitia besnoiti]
MRGCRSHGALLALLRRTERLAPSSALRISTESPLCSLSPDVSASSSHLLVPRSSWGTFSLSSHVAPPACPRCLRAPSRSLALPKPAPASRSLLFLAREARVPLQHQSMAPCAVRFCKVFFSSARVALLPRDSHAVGTSLLGSSAVGVGRGLLLCGVFSLLGFFAVCRLAPDEARQFTVVRCLRAGGCLAGICVDYKLWGGSDMSGCHARSAQRLLRLAEANRGVYVKLGQHVAAMSYLLPPAYTETLAVLQAGAPTSSPEDVFAVLRKELGVRDLSEVFSEFDPQPVGAASLAQVHFARLRDGRPVAVKVQHREVAELARVDTLAVQILEGVAERVFPQVKLKWLAELVEKNLPEEVDFLKEAANAEKLSSLLSRHASLSYDLPSSVTYNFFVSSLSLFHFFDSFWLRWRRPASASPSSSPPPERSASETPPSSGASPLKRDREPGRQEPHLSAGEENTVNHEVSPAVFHEYEIQLRVPAVHRELSTSRVLIMERAPGVPADDLAGITKQGIHPLAVSRALNQLYEILVFREGFVHADPHPGNVLIHLEREAAPGELPAAPLRDAFKPENASAATSAPVVVSPSPASAPASGAASAAAVATAPLATVPAADAGRGARASRRGCPTLAVYILDHGLYCQLSPAFRENYAQLWLGVLRGDRAETAASCRFFGVEELAGLLQIILTLRSESSLEGGITRSRKSVEEDAMLRASFPEYFTRITEVLQLVPREFVLLIKTNDLLRAIQTKLGLDERLALVPVAHASLLLATECKLRRNQNASVFWRWWVLLRLKVTLWSLSLAERLLARRALHALETTAAHEKTNLALDALSGAILALL